MFPELTYIYSIVIFTGIVAMLFYLNWRIKKYKLPDSLIDRLIIIVAFSGAVMLFSAFFFNSLFHYLEDTSVEWKWQGITYMGGFIGAFVAFVVLFWFGAKSERKNLMFYLNLLIVGVVLAHAFGRLACLLGGCCFGIQTDAWYGVTYPIGSEASRQLTGGLTSVKVIPTNLFESIFLFGLFFLLANLKKNQLVVYLFSYGVWRFMIEFIRGDDRGTFIEPLSPSQFMSLLYIVIGLTIVGVQYYRHLHPKSSSKEEPTK